LYLEGLIIILQCRFTLRHATSCLKKLRISWVCLLHSYTRLHPKLFFAVKTFILRKIMRIPILHRKKQKEYMWYKQIFLLKCQVACCPDYKITHKEDNLLFCEWWYIQLQKIILFSLLKIYSYIIGNMHMHVSYLMTRKTCLAWKNSYNYNEHKYHMKNTCTHIQGWTINVWCINSLREMRAWLSKTILDHRAIFEIGWKGYICHFDTLFV